MKISRHQIIAFATVAQQSSFSKAAERLNIGQSAITQHISALENAVGTQLFNRYRAGAQLTNIGRKLFTIADQMSVLEEQFYEQAKQYNTLNAGHLSICISTADPAMAVIAGFKQCYPGVNIDLKIAPWKEALNLVSQRSVDIAIAIKPEREENDLFFQDIEAHQFKAILPVNHRLKGRDQISIEDLMTETIVMLSDSSYTFHCVNRLFNQQQLRPQKTLTTDSYEIMFEAVRHGLGCSVAFEHVSNDYSEICAIPIKELPEKHVFSVICLKSKASLRVIDCFIKSALQYNIENNLAK